MPTLFDPIKAGALELPNRIIMAPLTRSRAAESWQTVTRAVHDAGGSNGYINYPTLPHTR